MEIYPTTCGRRGNFSYHTGYDSERFEVLLGLSNEEPSQS